MEDQQLANRMIGDLAEEIRIDKPLPHVTELIYCLTRSWYNRKKPLPPTPKETMLFAVGVGLEQVLLKQHRQHIGCCNSNPAPCPGYDGIHYDIDFLDYEEETGELKSTRISSASFIERMPETWKKQVLSYLKVRARTLIILPAMHLMGDYKPPFPDLRVWKGVATQEEIDTHWEWMVMRRDIYLDAMERDEPPKQFTYQEPWECDNCAYKLLCDARQSMEGD